MKKTLGVLIVAVCFLAAGILNVFGVITGHEKNDANQVAATTDHFSGMNTQFSLFHDDVGIFILKEESKHNNINEFFNGGVMLTVNSGSDESGNAYYDDKRIDWEYQAVMADTSGFWHPSDIVQIQVQPGRRSVTYGLPRAAVAGDYGIKVTASINGEPLVDRINRPVSGVYVIKYAEELAHMYCIDQSGKTSYDVFGAGGGLNKYINVSVVMNPGAVRTDSMEKHETSVQGEPFTIGNVGNAVLDIGLTFNNLNFHIEDAWGNVFEEDWMIVPIVEKVDGVFQVYLPPELGRGNYVLRVYHNVTDEVFGTFIIQYGGVFMEPGPGLEAMAPVMLIGGVVFVVIFGLMFLVPKVTVAAQQVKYQSMETKRIKKARQSGDIGEEWHDASGKRLTPEEIEKLSDADREALLKQRSAAQRESRSGKFLGKMAENRQKREIAREAGLTMEEFNELEARLKKDENRKEVSLASFRKAIEDKDSYITSRQEQEVLTSKKAAEVRPKREEGQPEFDMLDSLKGNQELAQKITEQIGKEKKEDTGSILQRLRNITGEDN